MSLSVRQQKDGKDGMAPGSFTAVFRSKQKEAISIPEDVTISLCSAGRCVYSGTAMAQIDSLALT
jgi:hypothetical protein